MAFKVNYGLERAERNRAKQAKKDAKIRNRNSGTGGDETPSLDEQPSEAEATKVPEVPPASGT